jgi:1,4-dihydroxy-2-naphthoate octaprenyltransferase
VLLSLLDGLTFSSVWVALAASALCAASSRAMGVPVSGAVIGLVFAGTLVVYNVDRLRDLERDRETSPRRTAFVARQASGLMALCGLSTAAAGVLVLRLGPGPALLLLPVLALGLAHRRVKRFALAKASYLTLAWLIVVVALPAVAAAEARQPGWTALVIGLAIAANAIASNVRDVESSARGIGGRRGLWMARGLAAVAICAALAGPEATRALALVPMALLAALAPFRAEERYGLLVVDGALLVGGAAAWLVQPWLV